MKPKIFLGSQEISGIMDRVNRAYRSMGYKSDFFCMYNYQDNDPNDPAVLKGYRKHTKMLRSTRNKLLKSWLYVLQMIDILHVFGYCIKNYDYFLYIFGHGMFMTNRYLKHFQELEFYILKKKKKKMIMWLCGSDSRAPYCGVDLYHGDYEKMKADTVEKFRKIHMLEKYMLIIDNPASSHFHSKPYIVYQAVGVPIDAKEIVERNHYKNNKITILHCPSKTFTKGTVKIREIIEDIKADGYDLDYVEITGRPHQEVLDAMIHADIVIDQLYSDTPNPGLSTEASINGIPVIIGGYFSEYYKKYIPEPVSPTMFCHPDKMKETIIELISNEELRKTIGEREKQYVLDNNMSDIVAHKILHLFEGDIPDSCFFDPKDNEYTLGLGLSEEQVIDNVYNMVERYGIESLQLDKTSRLCQKYNSMFEQRKKEIADNR